MKMNENDHTKLVEEYFESFFRGVNCYFPSSGKLPEEIIDSISDDGWIKWKLLKSKVSFSEEKIDIEYPELFKKWLTSYYTLTSDIGILRLPTFNILNPFKDLNDLIDFGNSIGILEKQLIPFGDECNDVGPLVFDLNYPNKPIRFYETQFFGSDEGIGPIIFSDFESLLKCSISFMNNYDKIGYNAINYFFEIDPKGAGESGKGYWKFIIEQNQQYWEGGNGAFLEME